MDFCRSISFTEEIIKYTDKLSLELGRRPRAFVRTFGCQQNEADSERLRGMLCALGYELAEDEKSAEIILVNTCAIREHAEIKALSSVGQYKHLKTKNPKLIIGVCGCMAAEKHRADQLKNSYIYVDFTLPPDLSSTKRAPRGEYKLHSTGEIVVDPDFIATWNLTKPKEE